MLIYTIGGIVICAVGSCLIIAILYKMGLLDEEMEATIYGISLWLVSYANIFVGGNIRNSSELFLFELYLYFYTLYMIYRWIRNKF